MTGRFLERLKSLQGEASDAEFARRCGVKYTTMKNYLTGRNFPPLDVAGEIAAAHEVSIDWLFGNDAKSLGSRASQRSSAGVEPAGAIIKLLGEAIAATYRDERVKLPSVGLVAEVARFYPLMMERMENRVDVDEARALLPWLDSRVRKEIREAAVALGTGKREAS